MAHDEAWRSLFIDRLQLSRKSLYIVIVLTATLVVGGALVRSVLSGLVFATVLGILGAIAFKNSRMRSGSLLIASLTISVLLLQLFQYFAFPPAMGSGLVRTVVPSDWLISDEGLGYRPRPNSKAFARASWEASTIYDVTYTIDADGGRVTPRLSAGTETYLFIGDSFIFGEGLQDADTLAAQFANITNLGLNTAIFAAPGYAPNHLVRAMEVGLFNRFKSKNVQAVITWLIPAQLSRVVGEGAWLGSSPRYVLDHGMLRHTGTFHDRLWQEPLSGIFDFAKEEIGFLKAIRSRQLEKEQADLFLALVARLEVLTREYLGAQLVVVYTWPDQKIERSGPPVATEVLQALRKFGEHHGLLMIHVDELTRNSDETLLHIPHDGHPSAFTNRLVADALKRHLTRP